MNNLIQKGIYEHYKGNQYEVIDIALNSETEEKMVIYRALYGNFDLWVRPLQMFLELIEIFNTQIPRFKLISETDSKKIQS